MFNIEKSVVIGNVKQWRQLLKVSKSIRKCSLALAGWPWRRNGEKAGGEAAGESESAENKLAAAAAAAATAHLACEAGSYSADQCISNIIILKAMTGSWR